MFSWWQQATDNVTSGHNMSTIYYPVPFPSMTYHRICKKSSMTDATSGAGSAYPSGTPEFTPTL